MGPIWQVLPTAPNIFSFNRSDEERSQALWHWAKQYTKESPSIKPEHCFTLTELQQLENEGDENAFLNRDITVMVVEKYRYQPSSVLPHGLLRVWDGTGNPHSDPWVSIIRLFQNKISFAVVIVPHSYASCIIVILLSPCSLFMQRNIVDQPATERGTAYLKAIEQIITASQQLQASIDTMEIPKTLCGRVSNVVIWEKSHWALINEHIPIGTFLRLRNVQPQKWEDDNFRCK